MADPTRESPESPGPMPSRRRRRRQQGDRRKRIALVLLLLALATGAVVLAPGLIELIQVDRRNRGPLPAPPRHARTDKPLPMRNWRFDFSMGPILELIEQSLNLEPFDLRRPLRIPFQAAGMPRGASEILLSQPDGQSPSFVPGSVTPLGDLPPSFRVADLRGDIPPLSDPGSDIPNGEPEFDPELHDDDSEVDVPDDDPDPDPNPDPDPDPDPDPVPAPPALPLVISALALAALRRRMR